MRELGAYSFRFVGTGWCEIHTCKQHLSSFVKSLAASVVEGEV